MRSAERDDLARSLHEARGVLQKARRLFQGARQLAVNFAKQALRLRAGRQATIGLADLRAEPGGIRGQPIVLDADRRAELPGREAQTILRGIEDQVIDRNIELPRACEQLLRCRAAQHIGGGAEVKAVEPAQEPILCRKRLSREQRLRQYRFELDQLDPGRDPGAVAQEGGGARGEMHVVFEDGAERFVARRDALPAFPVAQETGDFRLDPGPPHQVADIHLGVAIGDLVDAHGAHAAGAEPHRGEGGLHPVAARRRLVEVDILADHRMSF
ncbi:hypothetical protein SDC9_45159 [bioreactor metagenome]|uniref:Uncharacterized protein n=1 Tax=bioreactor metagenome TaxID=1076179 RepID=A0A644W5U0_9ZZZZ